jgi:hypothetical protein
MTVGDDPRAIAIEYAVLVIVKFVLVIVNFFSLSSDF